MEGLFQYMEDTALDPRSRIFTVLDGAAIGQKAVSSGEAFLWESVEGGFFSTHHKELSGHTECGIVSAAHTRVFCDCVGGETKLVICGGGHVSIPVIRMGVMLGWDVTVLEDRPVFAENAARAGAGTVLCREFDEGLDQIDGDENTYFVVLTRGHRHDQLCLEKILKKRHAYIGMIGSRRRSALVRQNLSEMGFGAELLSEIASPIGLDIGAETPEEIGVAIIAQIIAQKNRTVRSFGYPQEILRAIRDTTRFPGGRVLATIVSRTGSAPRKAGTKMLVCSGGITVGTIGGGCLEAEVIRLARRMIAIPGFDRFRLCEADMRGTDAEEEGMVCGGSIEVFLEIV